MASEDVTLRILADIKQASKSIDQFVGQTEKQLTQLANNTSFGKLLGANLLGNLAGGAIEKVIGSITGAIGDLKDVIVNDSVAAAASYQVALNELQTSLELTGKASESAISGFEDFASAIQATTKFSDDAVLSSAALIQSIGNLTPEALESATKAALDFAAATGKDLSTATELVAKAAAGNVSAFSRYGVAVQKGKDDTETFANALQALSKFSGAAEKTVNTFSGALTQNKNAFDDVLKGIGNLVVKSPAVIGAFKGINAILVSAAGAISGTFKGQDPFRNIINSALDLSNAIVDLVIRPLIILAQTSTFVFDILRAGIQTGIAGFAGLGTIVASTLNLVGAVSDEAAQGFEDFATSAQSTLIDFSNQANDSFAKIGDTSFADGITKQVEVIRTSVANQLTALPDIANKAGADTSAALDSALQSKIIEIAIRFASPEEIQAKLDEQFAVIDAAVANHYLTEQEAILAKETFIAESEQRTLDQQLQNAIARGEIDKQNQTQQLLFQQQYLDARLKAVQGNIEQEKALQQKQAALDKQVATLRLNQAAGFFGDLSSLTQTKNKELFEIGKAAALANAIINGFLAVQNALAVPPFPVGLALAAAAAVKAAVQISGIQSQGLATGITAVPAGFPNDTFPASLTSGERVLSVPQNQDLNRFLQSQDQKSSASFDDESKGLLGAIVERLGNLENTIIVNIGPREIMREVREGIRSGQQVAV